MLTKMVLLAGVILVAAAAPAAAGGWAVSTLDQPPAQLVAGQAQPVGFTIRQHGVTPVNPDSGQIGIRLTPRGGGQPVTVLAVAQGPVGHFMASVDVAATGTWSWEILQGWFEPQQLGDIEVVSSGSGVAPALTIAAQPSSTGAEGWRIAAVVVAAVLAFAFLADLVVGRRRRDHRAAVPA